MKKALWIIPLATFLLAACQPTQPKVVPSETAAPLAEAAATDEPAAPTEAPSLETTATEEPSATPTEVCNYDSDFVADITIPDGSLMNPGSSITKTWRIRNNGDCAWTEDFEWLQTDAPGYLLAASPATINLPNSVPPGATLDISMTLTLDPSAELGTAYRPRFQMRSPDGEFFGTRPFALVIASPGSGICTVPITDTKVYVNVSDGYCFLIPSSYSANAGSFSAPGTDGGGENLNVSMSIDLENAAGKNTNQYANDKIEAAKIPGSTPDTSTVSLDGENAIWTEDLPSQAGARITYLVHNGQGFTISLIPEGGNATPVNQEAEAFWTLVTNTWMWISP